MTHLCPVHNLNDINQMLSQLKSIKIAKATHNIMAYRFYDINNHLHCDYDDDGEIAAGKRLSKVIIFIKLYKCMCSSRDFMVVLN